MFKRVIRYTLGSLIQLLFNLIQYPFSLSSRHKLSSAYLALKYPFYGERNVELYELLQNNELQITVAPLKAHKHNTTEFELLSICAIIKDRQIQKVFEIGTFDGRTTRAMAINTEDKGFVYTLNLPPGTKTSQLETGNVDIQLASKVISGERFLNTFEGTKILQLWGDSATFDFTPYNQKIDMVFIDGAHSEDYVYNDTIKALELVKKEGGFIIWHDAHLFGVVGYLKKLVFKEQHPVYFIKGTTLAVAAVKDGKFTEIKREV